MLMFNHQSIILLLLDLLAAFDTVDQNILLDRLTSRFGVTASALSLFGCYLCLHPDHYLGWYPRVLFLAATYIYYTYTSPLLRRYNMGTCPLTPEVAKRKH